MIKVGDKVVVTEVPEGCGLEGIEVGSVGEVVKRFDETCVDILFGDGKKFLGYVDEGEYLKSKNRGYTHVFLVEKFDNKGGERVMLEVGDKVVVTEVLDGTLEGVEVGKVGEVVGVDCSDYVQPYLIDFGDYEWWSGEDFLVEKVEDVETGETPSEGEIKGAEIRHSVNVVKVNEGEGLTVEEVIKSVIEENKCGNKPNKALTTDNEDTFKVGEDGGEGNHTSVRGSSLASQNMPINGVQGFALEETETCTEEKQDTEESDNTPEEGAYGTVIKKDGLTIYTNYSVEVVGEVMRVGGVDDLVSNFDESEEG